APASASSNGRRNTAIGLGAAALYELLDHKTTNGLLLGAGAAYAYKRYQDERRDDRRFDRVAYRDDVYGGRSGYGRGSSAYDGGYDYGRRYSAYEGSYGRSYGGWYGREAGYGGNNGRRSRADYRDGYDCPPRSSYEGRYEYRRRAYYRPET